MNGSIAPTATMPAKTPPASTNQTVPPGQS
jgi:hypothetical protein